MRILLAFYLLLVGASGAATEDHWPRFRGANANGVAPDHKGLPTNWATTENVKWVADVPGWGWSCPIVWGDRVFLTTVVGDEENTRGKREREKGSGEGKGVRLNYRQAPPAAWHSRSQCLGATAGLPSSARCGWNPVHDGTTNQAETLGLELLTMKGKSAACSLILSRPRFK